MSKKIPAQLINAVGLISFYSLAILWPLGNNLIYIATTASGIVLSAFLCIRAITKRSSAELSLIYLALMLSAAATAVILFWGEKFNLYVVNSIAAVGLVFAFGLIRSIHARIPLYAFIGIFWWLIFDSIDVDESIIGVGQNGITLHILVLYILYFFRFLYPMAASISRVVMYENYAFAAMLFTISVWSQGRAATIAALIVLCVASLILMDDFAGRKKYWVVLATLLIVFFNYLSPPLMGERPYSSVDRIALSGFSDIRYKVWADYFQTLSPESLLMGNRDSNCHMILQGYSRENCNVHSSYLRAHQAYGLFGVLAISLAIFWCFRRLARRGEWFAMLIVSVLLARVATDEIFFIYPYLFALFVVFTKVAERGHIKSDAWSGK